MKKIIKIAITFLVISFFVVILSLSTSRLLRPNIITPVTQLIPPSKNSVKLPSQVSIAAWIWKSPTEIENFNKMLEFSESEGINTLYLYIDEYIDIYEMPNSSEKNQKLDKFQKSLENIISSAKSKNIKVHALSGQTSFSYDSHSYIPPILINEVFEFNRTHPDAKFEGIQFDIEFYEDPRFYGDPQEYTKNYLALISQLVTQVNNLNEQYQDHVRLGFVIPFWFDTANDYLSKPILKDIIELVSETENPYLVIMAYRNVIGGDGGVMDISKVELEETKNTPVKIVIAQEILENKETKITHYGKSKADIKNDLIKIIDQASSYPNFEGISIHDIEGFMKTL